MTREREESRRLREESESEVRRRWTRHHAPEKQEKEVCLHGQIGERKRPFFPIHIYQLNIDTILLILYFKTLV